MHSLQLAKLLNLMVPYYCYSTLGPKNDPPAAVQSKVLALIQAWAETFKQQPELSGVCQVYADLRHKGVEFPPPEAHATPIITPHAVCISFNPPHSTGSLLELKYIHFIHKINRIEG